MSYYYKYLKYKNKYLQLKKQKGGSRIPKGTFLFRTAPSICNYQSIELCQKNVQKCSDTGKTGIYFADNILVSICMCLEYDKLMEIGIFQIIDDIRVGFGKYAFRDINPERYFDIHGNLISHVYPNKDENISHVDCELNLLKLNDSKTGLEVINFSPEKQEEIERFNLCEIFLTEPHINNIKLIDQYRFNPDIIKNVNDLKIYLELNNYPLNHEKYIEDGILIRYDCK
jgi:hypothetical protein